MKGYKSSEVYGKLKAAQKRFERLLAVVNIPGKARDEIISANTSIKAAVAEYDRLREKKQDDSQAV
jgi:hypothetical protein